MVNSIFNITVTTNNNAVTMGLVPISGDNYLPLEKIKRFFAKAILGSWNTSTYVTTGMTIASGTVTLSSFVASDTITINGRVYTGSASPSGAQQFLIGASDTATAANFAAIMNADTSILVKGVVKASSSAAIITITSLSPGNIGNLMTIAISAHGSVSGTGKLTGGTQGTSGTITHGL